jgi:hypothetical protein
MLILRCSNSFSPGLLFTPGHPIASLPSRIHSSVIDRPVPSAVPTARCGAAATCKGCNPGRPQERAGAPQTAAQPSRLTVRKPFYSHPRPKHTSRYSATADSLQTARIPEKGLVPLRAMEPSGTKHACRVCQYTGFNDVYLLTPANTKGRGSCTGEVHVCGHQMPAFRTTSEIMPLLVRSSGTWLPYL